MDRRIKILIDEFNPAWKHCRTYEEDLQVAVTLNPDIDKIKNAMDENGKQMCLDLLEYMAKNKYECFLIEDVTGNITHCFSNNGRDYLTKQQLFENFL